MSAQRRENFRIIYPQAERPVVLIGSEKFKVIDLAAAGLKIDVGGRLQKFKTSSQHHSFQIALLCGKTITASGKFFRNSGTQVVFRLLTEIPFAMINQEQIYLRSRYPGYA